MYMLSAKERRLALTRAVRSTILSIDLLTFFQYDALRSDGTLILDIPNFLHALMHYQQPHSFSLSHWRPDPAALPSVLLRVASHSCDFHRGLWLHQDKFIALDHPVAADLTARFPVSEEDGFPVPVSLPDVVGTAMHVRAEQAGCASLSVSLAFAVILVPDLERDLHRVGFRSIEFYSDWDARTPSPVRCYFSFRRFSHLSLALVCCSQRARTLTRRESQVTGARILAVVRK
jgi:hypothetical protein